MKKYTALTAVVLLACGCAAGSSAETVSSVKENKEEETQQKTAEYDFSGDEIVDASDLLDCEVSPDVLTGTWEIESINTPDGYMPAEYSEETGELAVYEDMTADFSWSDTSSESVSAEHLRLVFRKGVLYLSGDNQEWYAEAVNDRGEIICRFVPEYSDMYLERPKDAAGETVYADYFYVKTEQDME